MKHFFTIMQKCEPYFKVFAYSGTVILLGLFILIYSALKILSEKRVIKRAAD
jgi:hypothetical protein